MQAVVNPGYISGTVKVPGSKSMTQRALAAALLHTGSTIIRNAGNSADDLAALHIIQQLGAKVHTLANNEIEINSHGVQPISNKINCGESGLSARLFTPIASISHLPITITGSGSLLDRPMDTFNDILRHLHISTDLSGTLPFAVKGPLKVQDITIDGSQSSQFLTGLLVAYAFTAHEPVTITVTNLKSRPYIDLTLSILEKFGKRITHENYCNFHIQPSVSITTAPVVIDIESDWSSAAYWMVAAAINGEVTVEALNLDSLQADKAILNVLQSAGVSMSIGSESITVRKSRIRGFDFDATDAPDLFPVLAILASFSEEETYITGLHRLWNKESNRATSIADMLHSLEIDFSIEDDSFCIRGTRQVTGGFVDPYNDHRIAMAASIAAIRSRNAVIIDQAHSVSKSYPDFFKHLQSLHIQCSFSD